MNALTQNPAVAVVYRRVSSAQQGRGDDTRDGGWSLQSQEQRAEEYAAANGYRIVETFEEVASAAKRGRPVFEQLLHWLEAHPCAHLLVEKWDRLSRNTLDRGRIEALVEECGVTVHLMREGKTLSA